MTFKLELSDNRIFKDAFDSISRIVDDVQIQVDSEGLRLKALDRSHITFIVLDLQAELFDEFMCDVPEKINIDSTELMKVLKKCKTSDVLKLSVDESNLIVIFEGDATRKFKIRFIDLEYDNPTPSNINFTCNLNVPSQLFLDALNDMDLFSDKLTITVDLDNLIISTDGELGDASTRYIHGEKITEIIRATYSIDKLKDIMKASKFSEQVTLSLGNDMPIKVEFKLITGDGQLEYLLAPRLETSD